MDATTLPKSSKKTKISRGIFQKTQNISRGRLKSQKFRKSVFSKSNDSVNIVDSKNTEVIDHDIWKLYDRSDANEDGDQLKAVIGICSLFGTLFVMGLYANLI